MDFIKTYTAYIESELSKLQLPSKPAALYEPIRYFLQIGGKRIRPMMTLLGAELFGLDKEKAINAALAIELLHNFSLIHDDIMDDAPLRRGYETVHVKWNTSVGILSGDALLIKSYQLLEQQEGDLRQLLHVFNKTAIKICEGQQFDMDFEKTKQVSSDEYIEMIRLKTSVLIGSSLELASIIAQSSEIDRQHAYNFGVNLGLAFQIQDDILDLYGDPEKFGKQIGGDILANKKTLLYLLAIENGDEKQIEKLAVLYNESNSTKKVNETKLVFDEIGVRQLCAVIVNNYFDTAKEELLKINVSVENKLKLNELSNFLLNRTS